MLESATSSAFSVMFAMLEKFNELAISLSRILQEILVHYSRLKVSGTYSELIYHPQFYWLLHRESYIMTSPLNDGNYNLRL